MAQLVSGMTSQLPRQCGKKFFMRQTPLIPAEPCGNQRQPEDGCQAPTHPPLPDPRASLLVGALPLRFRQRFGLFQLMFFGDPFGFGSAR